MVSKAEMEGVKSVAKSMSDKDLKWQIANSKKLGIPPSLNQAFKDELASRKYPRYSEPAKYGL